MAASKSLNRVVIFIGGLAGAGGEERLLWEEEKFFREKGIETTVLTFSLDKSALYAESLVKRSLKMLLRSHQKVTSLIGIKKFFKREIQEMRL